jgi:hypothetical protein
MGIVQKLQLIFSNHNETKEDHVDERLRSHYYKVTKSKAFTTIKDLVTELAGFTISSLSEERGEIGVSVTTGKKILMVVTIVSLRPLETAIDFSVTSDTKMMPIDFGYSRNMIIKFYEMVNKELPLIGSGIYANRKVW